MENNSKNILGLDLGTTSVGWALLSAEEDGGSLKPTGMVKSGVRIFPEGLDRRKGEQPLNQERRIARQIRRQTRRRARRKTRLLNLLIKNGLLPANTDERANIFNQLDPYQLRKKAIAEKLSLFELGRAFYHLGQRRGYLSNRKTGDAKNGVVTEGISQLADNIIAGGYKTLGEYLASLNPHEQRRRGMYTSRQMFLDEFNTIWDIQQKYYADLLTAALRGGVFQAIFHQRPLKLQKSLVGKCTFEKERKRVPVATLVFQEFRLWQDLNALRLIQSTGEERELSIEEREAVADELQYRKEISWGKLKDLLSILETDIFNLEISKTKGLKGNPTSAVLKTALRRKWTEKSFQDKEMLVYDLLNIESEEVLARRLKNHWQLTAEEVVKVVKASQSFPKGYSRLSSKAMRKMLPFLKEGLIYSDASLKAGYHHSHKKYETVEELPFPPELRNPLVERAMYQVRKVVNAIVKQYGVPDIIRIEMARDLKLSARQRATLNKKNRDNKKLNDDAREFLLKEFDMASPSRTDIMKFRLWEECGHECPYTGKAISAESLFGTHPQFDIEHILPYRRSLDDSFINKALCEREENSSVKGNKTPFEAYSGEAEKYELILRRVKDKFPWKLNRFRQKEIDLDSAVSRQLNDTRYIARETSEYLKQLGCKVQVATGRSTAVLRRSWGLAGLLGDGEKTRSDHRHHAVDAIVVACTSPGTLQAISRTSAFTEGRIRIEELPDPFEGFWDKVCDSIFSMLVSHKKSRKIAKGLHDETVYGLVDEERSIVTIRKPLSSFSTKKQLLEIVDDKIRELALLHLEKHGSFKDAFQSVKNQLLIPTKDGKGWPVKKVRIQRSQKVFKVPRGYVAPGTNYQLRIHEKDIKGKKKWRGEVISTFAAKAALHKNMQAIKPAIILHKNDLVSLCKDKQRDIWRVQKLSQNSKGGIIVVLRPHWDASIDLKEGTYLQKTDGSLQEVTPVCVDVNVLGEIIAGGTGTDP